ncbi:hypothetical protein RchiOBHm_Chr3g0490701 [Rosa chinensis]|uniref:Uncharacterized protein n=1 Tax=Rosa chinensis TaxID=74649 RepID=A0A2P6RG22_ROSCH|nr:hypothetical protein RchiOBHm_Chr3g0490701 [Rosa chinensis]
MTNGQRSNPCSIVSGRESHRGQIEVAARCLLNLLKFVAKTLDAARHKKNLILERTPTFQIHLQTFGCI